MKPENRFCIYCETPLKGRSDKQFCNASCKSAHHNSKPNSAAAYINTLNKQLRTNRSALRTACPLGKATVRKEFLRSLGMDFKYITHSWQGKGGQAYNFCYDYGYGYIEDAEKVVIIQQQPYMIEKG